MKSLADELVHERHLRQMYQGAKRRRLTTIDDRLSPGQSEVGERLLSRGSRASCYSLDNYHYDSGDDSASDSTSSCRLTSPSSVSIETTNDIARSEYMLEQSWKNNANTLANFTALRSDNMRLRAGVAELETVEGYLLVGLSMVLVLQRP